MSETNETDKTATAGKTVATSTEAKASPEDMLTQAIGVALGEAAAPAAPAAAGEGAAAPVAARRAFRLGANGRLAAAASVALVCGLSIGLTVAPRERSGEALVQLRAGIEAGRTESARLAQEVERLARTVTSLRETGEAVRGEIKAASGSLADRIGRAEQALDRRLTALSETAIQADREQAAKIAGLAAQIEKKPLPMAAAAKPAAKVADPVQTGSLPDKPKPDTVEGWAVRDVYDGVAILEDRRRRLVEVGTGDAVPGIGRVEAIERRGRIWVVVTRQGLITPQTW